MAGESEDHAWMLSNRLHQAIDNGELEHVRMYIEDGADVNRQSYSEMYGYMYPLAHACCHGHEEVMEELLKAGADPNQDLDSGLFSMPAMAIASERHVLTLSMLRCLVSYGADVNFIGGMTILHYLTGGLSSYMWTDDSILSAAMLVLDNGVSVYARDKDGYTPLYCACRSGNIDLVKLFIAEGADVNFDIGHITMLSVAADGCNIDMFDMLLKAGANRRLTPRALSSPCHRNDHDMSAKILDTCVMDINTPLDHYGGMTILHNVCQYRDTSSETVRLLLDRGADVRAVSDTGDTALHYAAIYCDCIKICQFLSYNPPLNIKNNNNQTPLSKPTQDLINHYSQSRQQADTQGQRDYFTNVYQAGVLAFKMLVTAGAKVTADDEHKLNKFCIKHPEAQLPDYEISFTRSLKEMCRFVIRGSIPVPVDVSLCKLPIPKLLQEYLNFPECDQLVDKYLNLFAAPVATTTTSTTTTTTNTTSTRHDQPYHSQHIHH